MNHSKSKRAGFYGQSRSREESSLEFPCRVTFRLTSKHMDELEALARAEGMTRSFMVRHLVVRFLESRRVVKPVPDFGAFQ